MRSETPLKREPRAWRVPSLAVYRTTLVAAAGMALAVTAVVALSTAGWIGKPFPGFFVLPNRVIPSVGATGWSGTRDGAIFQRVVLAVDGKPIDDNAATYRWVAARPAGAEFAYTLRHGSATEPLTLQSSTFSAADYWLVFGSYAVTGLLYLLLGVVGAWLLPDAALGRALLLVGGAGGIFALTGAGIYQPGADLRIHAVAESVFPATLVHLAVVLACVERRYVVCVSAVAGWISLALAVPYQLVLFQPSAYSLLHGACETYMGMAGLAVGTTLIVARSRAARDAGPFLRAAVAGAVLGIGVPATIMALSGVSGGALPVNFVTATAFLFPLGMTYGLWREHAPLSVAPRSSSPDFIRG
jgi:hypothetical protein